MIRSSNSIFKMVQEPSLVESRIGGESNKYWSRVVLDQELVYQEFLSPRATRQDGDEKTVFSAGVLAETVKLHP